MKFHFILIIYSLNVCGISGQDVDKTQDKVKIIDDYDPENLEGPVISGDEGSEFHDYSITSTLEPLTSTLEPQTSTLEPQTSTSKSQTSTSEPMIPGVIIPPSNTTLSESNFIVFNGPIYIYNCGDSKGIEILFKPKNDCDNQASRTGENKDTNGLYIVTVLCIVVLVLCILIFSWYRYVIWRQSGSYYVEPDPESISKTNTYNL